MLQRCRVSPGSAAFAADDINDANFGFRTLDADLGNYSDGAFQQADFSGCGLRPSIWGYPSRKRLVFLFWCRTNLSDSLLGFCGRWIARDVEYGAVNTVINFVSCDADVPTESKI